jgi:hypothetical protein
MSVLMMAATVVVDIHDGSLTASMSVNYLEILNIYLYIYIYLKLYNC